MTGSGKTGLGIDVIEEAAIDGMPVIAIDPKGDLGNLLLTFPRLRPADFAPWVDAGRGAPGRPDAGRVCRRRSREVVEGPRRVGPGRRAHRAAARRRRIRALHAGQLVRPAAVDREVVRRARSGDRERRRPAAGSRDDGGDQRADAGGRRRASRCAAASTRWSPRSSARAGAPAAISTCRR